MKQAFGIAIFCLLASTTLFAQATGHYLRVGATGNGSDWANACPDFTGACAVASLVRGDTYYIASGSYSSRDFNTATNGSAIITIKKATATDHGTDTGWSSAYGEGQAVFGPGTSSISTHYWVIDGALRTGLKVGYGFKFDTGPQVNPSNKGIRLDGSGNVTIRFVEIVGHGPDRAGGGNDLIYSNGSEGPVDNITITHSYLHDAGRTHLLTRLANNWVLEYSVMYRNESVGGSGIREHAESWSFGDTKNVVVRYNLFEQTEGTGVLDRVSLSGNNWPEHYADNWDIYGNVFLNCNADRGTISSDTRAGWTNSRFYDNVIIGGGSYRSGVNISHGAEGWHVYNNIWYKNRNIINFTTSHDYNAYYDNTDNGSLARAERHGQAGKGSPFTDVKAYDFHLKTATKAGTSLSGPSGCAEIDKNCYNHDPDGHVRGADGVWDRGAYEYRESSQQMQKP